MALSTAAAGASDDLTDTVDYAEVVGRVSAVVDGPTSYLLLEALAAAMADEVLAADSRIESVTLSVRKLQPPLPADLSTVGVRITRRQ
jgi:dihydroneopterin aldolase